MRRALTSIFSVLISERDAFVSDYAIASPACLSKTELNSTSQQLALWRLLVTLQSFCFSNRYFYLVSLISNMFGRTVLTRILKIKSPEHHLNASTEFDVDVNHTANL